MYVSVLPRTIVTVANGATLIAAWQHYGPTGLVGTFRCSTPLTGKQLRSLPKGLRNILEVDAKEEE